VEIEKDDQTLYKYNQLGHLNNDTPDKG